VYDIRVRYPVLIYLEGKNEFREQCRTGSSLQALRGPAGVPADQQVLNNVSEDNGQ